MGSLFLVGLPASQLPSLPRSPILLGNAIGGIPDPEPIIPDSGVWWWAARRRWQPRQGSQRPVELTEVKLHAQTERARRERERERERSGGDPGRTDGRTCCSGTYKPVPRSMFTSYPSSQSPRPHGRDPLALQFALLPPPRAIILAVSDDANLYPSHSTPCPCERSVGLSHVCDKVADYIPTFLAGRGVAAIEQQKRGREWRK